ncbi:MAG: cation:proton antiporter [Nitrospirota bacterium]
MHLFNIIAILFVLSALFAYLNHRFFKLPAAIGLMLISMVVSLALVFMGHSGLGFGFESEGVRFLSNVDFDKTLMVGMLGFMLFAGALKLNVNDLLEHKWKIGLFATAGLITSVLLVGSSMYFALKAIGLEMGYIYCLLFGAIVSPTDPIAVLGILKGRDPQAIAGPLAGQVDVWYLGQSEDARALPVADLRNEMAGIASHAGRNCFLDISEALRAAVPEAEVVVLDDLNHNYMIENPDVVAPVIRGFLDRVRPR